MLFRNAKLSSVETGYDPFQRAVGGIVLFLLMMLLYLILKAILGISATGREAALIAPRPDEVRSEAMVPATGQTPQAAKPKPEKLKYPMLDKFVFLDLKAEIMDGDAVPKLREIEAADADLDELDGSNRWIVQAASFRSRARAENLVKMLAEKDMQSSITEKYIKGRNWNVVSLAPQKDEQAALELKARLWHEMGLKGIVLER